MKQGTPDHPKMTDLATRLKIPRAFAVGIMETLWHWTARFCPDGLLRYAPEVVARACSWPQKDAGRLIQGLLDARWLDRHANGWMVHDWPDHCEGVVHRRLAAGRRCFADGSAPRLRYLDSKDRAAAEAYYRRVHAGEVETPPINRGDSTESPQQDCGRPQTNGGDSAADRSPGAVPLPLPIPLPLPLPVPLPEPVPVPESVRARSDAETAWNEFLEAYPSHTGVDAGCRWYQIQFERRPDPRAWHSEVMAGLRRHLESAKWRDPETGELDLRFVVSIPRFLGMPDGRDPTRGPMYVDRPPPWKPRAKRGRRSALEEMEGT